MKDLLLEDYRYLADSFWKNEQTGETRVNWFIAIVTAAMGGLVSLMTKDDPPSEGVLRFTCIACLLALLVFGTVTFFRILRRNEAADSYKKGLDYIRTNFRERFDPLVNDQEYQPFGESPPGAARKFGGLVHTVAVINCLVIAALAGAFLYPGHAVLAAPADRYPGHRELYLVIVTGIFFMSFLGLFLYLRRRDASVKKRANMKYTHAGGIVYSAENSTIRYLIVSPRNGGNERVFPKGHIEMGEEATMAALRELYEETGVIARIIFPVGDGKLTAKKNVRIMYFLMEMLGKAPVPKGREENRILEWHSFEKAKEQLTHNENKALLEKAEAVRMVLPGNSGSGDIR